MDPNGHIYRAAEEEIPAEDKARLDGYLRARADADEVKRLELRLNALEARTRHRLATPETKKAADAG